MAPARERDQPDPSLILKGGREKKQSKHAQGEDYPETVCAEEVTTKEGELRINTQVTPKVTIPEGDAVDINGNLKDAADMDWVYSPSNEAPSLVGYKRAHSEAGSETNESESMTVQKLTQHKRSHAATNSDTHSYINADDNMDRTHTTSQLSSPGPIGNDDDEGENEVDGDVEEDDEEDEENAEGNKRYRDLCIELGKHIPPKIKQTKDLRICFAQDVREINGSKVLGQYCSFCLEDKNVTQTRAFLTGNVTARRRHLLCKHIIKYVKRCEEKGVEPKTETAPPQMKEKLRIYRGGQKDGIKQKSLSSFVVKVPRPMVITKNVLKEMILALIVDADLSFRFVERPLFQWFILLLNAKLSDSDIPKKTCIASAVLEKVKQLDLIDKEIIAGIPSKISGVYDGWTTKRRRPFSLFSISYIYSPPNDDTSWTLKSMLLDFSHTKGRHTGEAIGKDLASVVEKFGFEKKIGWMIGDNITVNDSAIKVFCDTLDPDQENLVPNEVRGRCIEHTIHLMATHFIKALGIPTHLKTKHLIHPTPDDESETGDLDIDINMDIEADEGDLKAINATTILDYDTGDVIGKLMSFINQIRASSEVTCNYLKSFCDQNGCRPLELKLWVRTRWGSLSDCFRVTLELQDAIDEFCMLADRKNTLSKLRKGKKIWLDYKLSTDEWEIIKLAYNSLQIPASIHGCLSAEKVPTATKVYPHLEHLLNDWEGLRRDPEYKPVHEALDAGIKNMHKWYCSTTKTSIYLISHVIDPTLKMEYINAVWDDNEADKAMKRLKKVFLEYKIHTTDPYAELLRYLNSPILEPGDCPNIVAWWGVQKSEYPIMRLIARDYLSIPGSSCLAERSFSMSARTDDARRRQIGSEKFGALQRLRGAYRDHRLVPEEDILKEFIGDFSMDSNMVADM